MGKGKWLRQGVAMRGIWLCALALTVLTVVTTPLAVSKYVAQGKGQAKARVAAWEVEYEKDSLTGVADAGEDSRTIFLDDTRHTDSTGPSSKEMTFVVKLDSEVMTDIIVQPAYGYPTDPTISENRYDKVTQGVPLTVDASTGTRVDPYTFRYAPGPHTITFTITLRNAFTSAPLGSDPRNPGPTLDIDNYMRTYKIYFTAVQVD